MKKRLIAVIAALSMLFGTAGSVYAASEAPSAETAASAETADYENALFDTGYIHEIDITIAEEDWDMILSDPIGKPKAYVTASIDGEVYENVRFSPKGNASLALVAAEQSRRFSFKLNFGSAEDTEGYHGLEQFVLNNCYEDNSYLHDYAAAWLFRQMGVPAALMSYTKLYINGELYGVYLAAETPGQSLIDRELGGEGVLYKPESEVLQQCTGGNWYKIRTALQDGTIDEVMQTLSSPMFDPAYTTPGADLKYTDDCPESYTDIIENEVTDIDETDITELIAALKNLSEGNPDRAIDTDEVIRYFAVHNFIGNPDGYTNVMLHNYLLYENNGILSMIPWDYNEATAPNDWAVTGGTDSTSWTELINMGLDSPTYLEVAIEDRPMLSWIFENEEYYAEYIDVMQQIMAIVTSGAFEGEMQRMYAQIRPYVYEDPTAFCTPEEFDEGYQDVINFCTLRSESLQKQMDGELAVVTDEQDPADRVTYKE